MRHNEQGGTLIGFLVAGAVLVVLMIGGAFLVRHHPDFLSRSTSSAEVARTQTPTDKKSPSSTPKPDGSDKTDTKTPAPSTQPAPTPTSDTTTSTPTDSTTAPSSAAALPETGPAGVLSSCLIVGLLTLAATTYVRSRSFSRATL